MEEQMIDLLNRTHFCFEAILGHLNNDIRKPLQIPIKQVPKKLKRGDAI